MFSTVAAGSSSVDSLGDQSVLARRIGWDQHTRQLIPINYLFLAVCNFFSVPPDRQANRILGKTQAYAECFRSHQRPAQSHIRTPEINAAWRVHHHPILHSQCFLSDLRLFCCYTSSYWGRRRYPDAQRCGNADHHGPSGKRAEHYTCHICTYRGWIGAIIAGAFLQYSEWKWHFIFL